ncbi:hypothetical protein CLPUN_29060 [Clostridium puniceum]|uniref:Uncharacterized protein n=1 Tax=Clostridium puniceum TaxID=29367 RepID=A0A1S8TE97_9CLOT|nr:hypothetical protein [Clostridium puniceum]OOM76058.1 hypothetical protein CLPUN_29060 [Clostridium puniceum]
MIRIATAQTKSQVYLEEAKWMSMAEAWFEDKIGLQLSELTSYEIMSLNK